MHKHIGNILHERLQEPGAPTVKDFADLMSVSTRKIYHVYNGEAELTLQEVIRASEILKYDLISDYLKAQDKLWLLSEPAVGYTKKKKEISLTIHVCTTVDDLDKFPALMKDITQSAAVHGFRVV